MTVVELLRHAGAEPRHAWPEPDDRRPLDEAGSIQAAALADALAGAHDIGLIVSSPAVRCLQTVEPLAAKLGLEVREDERLAETAQVPVTDDGDAWVAAAWQGGRALRVLDEVVAEHPDGHVVLCSHGDVVPAVMALLAGRDGLTVTDVRRPKGGRFRLRFDGGRCVEAVPVPPPGTASRDR